MNVTLVAHYGSKSSRLEAFIESTNDILKTEFGSYYSPYSTEQVHATIVGLEHKNVNGKYYNSNYLTYQHRKKIMDLVGFVRYLQRILQDPINIRIGGYSQDVDYGFTSQGLHPMMRSFLIRSDKIISIGWPVQNNEVANQLASLRKSFEHYNILHKWHQYVEDKDNDFYFVLGLLDRSNLDDDSIVDVETNLRNRFMTQSPLEIDLSINNLKFVAYNDLTLPFYSSQILSLSDVYEDITNLIELFELKA